MQYDALEWTAIAILTHWFYCTHAETNSKGHFFKHDSAGATTNQWKTIVGFSSSPDLEYASSDLMKTSPSKSLF